MTAELSQWSGNLADQPIPYTLTPLAEALLSQAGPQTPEETDSC
jgi:hypothetical protein